MFLEKPAFPVLIEIGQAEGDSSHLLDSKGWHDYQFYTVSILYIPYYFFSYDIFDESSGKTKIVAKGSGALNANTSEFDEEVIDLYFHEQGKKSAEIGHNYTYDALKSRVSEREAKEIISVRLAAASEVARKNVLLSGFEMLFVPVWILNFTIAGKKLSLRMNATTGEVLNEEIIPMREKTHNDVVAEAIDEISDPRNWPRYAIDSVSDAVSFAAGFLTSRAPKESDVAKKEVRAEKPASAHAESNSSAQAPTLHASSSAQEFSGADWIVLSLAAIAILAIFWFFSRA